MCDNSHQSFRPLMNLDTCLNNILYRFSPYLIALRCIISSSTLCIHIVNLQPINWSWNGQVILLRNSTWRDRHFTARPVVIISLPIA